VQINLQSIKENKDGSADFLIHCDAETIGILVQEGIIAIIKEFIEQNKNAQAGIKMRQEMIVSHHKNGKVTTRKIKK
jgi:hypothetical protein